ncbi:MAG TPA: tat (twin-arginine translocation) pathway signal sequence [Methylibium sp.]|nr:tat (twin-arginine translocation) pathway signal sequence [Methylibium sp.]
MKTIAISLSVPSGECHEDDGRVPKLDLPLARREFLKGSGVLMGALASGSLLAALAPSTTWAVEMRKLTEPQGRALLALGRVLYPHEKLPDAVYALLVKDLDAKAAADAVLARQLRTGIAALDRAAGVVFATAPAAQQRAIVKSIEGTPFFATVRGQCITSLYDNDMAFAALGYPGSAWDKGGYITRGFQDLSWLPAPPNEASPPLFAG